MGACASVPKAMRVEDGGAPLPEKPNEETTTTEVPKVQAAEKEVTVDGGENKAEDGNDNAKQEDEKNKDDDHKSLESLLENEKVKELPKTTKISSETETVAEEQNSESLPVSDKTEGEPAEKVVAAYVAPVARATEEEKEAEKK